MDAYIDLADDGRDFGPGPDVTIDESQFCAALRGGESCGTVLLDRPGRKLCPTRDSHDTVDARRG